MTEQKRPWRDYYDNEYLTGDALPDEGRTFTITGKNRAELEGKDGKEHKLVLTFSDGNKWVVNVTNSVCCEHMFGSKFPVDWVGHAVTLIFDPTVKFGKDTVGGIRVKGSPELSKPLTFQFQENSRKKPRQVTLTPTGNGSAPASVDPATGEVTDAAEAAEDTQEPQDGVETLNDTTDAESGQIDADGDIPGRGALFDTDDPDRPATGPDKKQLTEAIAHVPTEWTKAYRKRFGGRSNSELTHGEIVAFTAAAEKEALE